MAPRSRQDSEATREASRVRLVDAAREVFAERGFFACRVADVASRAGMSPGNVYWHFDSKEDILRVILAGGFEALEAMTAGVAEEYGPARRKLEILVERTIAFYDGNAAFAVIRDSLAGRGGREVVRSLGFDLPDIERRSRANVRRVFIEARSEGAVSAADPELLVALYFAFFNGLALDSAGRSPALPPDALRAAALRLVGYRPAG